MSIFADPNDPAAKQYGAQVDGGMDAIESALGVVQKMAEYASLMQVYKDRKPVWMGAKGFDAAYEACMSRIGIAKRMGSLDGLDDLSEMHCYVGGTLHECHGVLTVPYSQISALPEIGEAEMREIGKTIKLPMRPYFIDVASEPTPPEVARKHGAGARYLPQFPSAVSMDGAVGYVGHLLEYHHIDPEILLCTSFVLYNENTPGGGVSCLGMVAINQSDDPTRSFLWDDRRYSFIPKTPFKAMIPESEFTDRHPEILPLYSDILSHGCGQALGILHLLDAANVKTVEAPLEKRDRKKVEKRGWRIPEVVYVHRSKRRSKPKGDIVGNGRQHTHQYDVAGFEAHVKRGTHVRCKVCLGEPLPGVVCSVCNGSGMNPEVVKPCTRIDEATGQKTCPQGCRREYHPPSVRGPEGAVYVPKVRKLVD